MINIIYKILTTNDREQYKDNNNNIFFIIDFFVYVYMYICMYVCMYVCMYIIFSKIYLILINYNKR